MPFPFFVSQDELKESCANSNRIPGEVKGGSWTGLVDKGLGSLSHRSEAPHPVIKPSPGGKGAAKLAPLRPRSGGERGAVTTLGRPLPTQSQGEGTDTA